MHHRASEPIGGLLRLAELLGDGKGFHRKVELTVQLLAHVQFPVVLEPFQHKYEHIG